MISAQHSFAQPQDYFLGDLNGGAGYMTPFGNDRERDSDIGFDYVSLPAVVSPGQQVPVELQWNYLNPLNTGATIYMNAFGDWQPGAALAQLVTGGPPSAGLTVHSNFTFTAPTTPGTYRIRIPFAESAVAVTNFYGGPNLGPFAPGVGAYTEVQFKVAPPSNLSLRMFAGLTLSGPPGNYTVECKNDLNQLNWISLTNLTMGANSVMWIDPNSPAYPQRFYRAVPVP